MDFWLCAAGLVFFSHAWVYFMGRFSERYVFGLSIFGEIIVAVLVGVIILLMYAGIILLWIN